MTRCLSPGYAQACAPEGRLILSSQLDDVLNVLPFPFRYGRHFAAHSLGSALIPVLVCLMNDLYTSVKNPSHLHSSSSSAAAVSNETIPSNHTDEDSSVTTPLLPFRVHAYDQYSATNPGEASVMLHYCFYGVLLAMSSVIVLTSQYETHRGSDLLRRSLRGFTGVGGRMGCFARSKFLCSDVR